MPIASRVIETSESGGIIPRMSNLRIDSFELQIPAADVFAVEVVADENARVTYVVEETVTVVEEFRLNHGFLLIYAQVSLILSLLAFFYVRKINREHGNKPRLLHKLCCPLLTVLRWEGFDGVEPLYAIVLGCCYTVFCWKPSEDASQDDASPQNHEADDGDDLNYRKLVDSV